MWGFKKKEKQPEENTKPKEPKKAEPPKLSKEEQKKLPVILYKKVAKGYLVENTTYTKALIKTLPKPSFYFTGKLRKKRWYCYAVDEKGNHSTPMDETMVCDVSDFDDINETAYAMRKNDNYPKVWEEASKVGNDVGWIQLLVIYGIAGAICIAIMIWGGNIAA